MAYVNKAAVFTYVHPDWQSESGWKVKRHQDLDDQEAAANLTITTKVRYDHAKATAAQRKGVDYIPDFDQEAQMSALKATLHVASDGPGLGWFGEEFRLPEDFPDVTKPVDPKTGDYPVHELAGQLPPCTAEYIGLREPYELDDMRKELNKLYAPRSGADEAAFRGGDTVPAESSGKHKASGGRSR